MMNNQSCQPGGQNELSMSFRIELHCDVGGPGGLKGRDDCMSNGSDRTAVTVWTKDAARSALRSLEASALKDGWTRVHAGWACPVCSPPKQIRLPRLSK
jgi:hypothetical protein